MNIFRIKASLTASLSWLLLLFWSLTSLSGQETAGNRNSLIDETPFGSGFPKLDSLAVGQWWTADDPKLLVPRNEVLAFSVYTVQNGVLKMTAQLFPLKPDESQSVQLEIDRGEGWQHLATASVIQPGWSAHLRIEPWDDTADVRFRLLHAGGSEWSGLIRRNPVDKNPIVMGALSCNSSRTPGDRATIVGNLKKQDPDLLFFAGDQSYHHTEHTFGWLEFGMQFREIMRDRPTITIPDDHDIGQPNLWGESGIHCPRAAGTPGGYFYPASYVNMVQRCQTWHLPDPVDGEPVERGITVYFTRLKLGGIDFAILEDRKFKSGPEGKIPQQGPRPDHIVDPEYDPATVDVPGLELLGKRQLDFLGEWGRDWSDADIKCVLSQTAFCGAVHMHGGKNDRLLADLDCNGWPQTGRNLAVAALRRCRATHVCGDQHLAVVVKHGIETAGDGPVAFTVPAIVNTIYGRWWHPADERAGKNPTPDTPLPLMGDFRDGFGNPFRMLAYANPANIQDETKRGDGYGIVRFDRNAQSVTFECWPRFSDVDSGDAGQYPGWPLTVKIADNDGRTATGWLPTLEFRNEKNAVIEVSDERTGEVVYTHRNFSATAALPVYSPGPFTIRVGKNTPNQEISTGAVPTASRETAGILPVDSMNP